MVEAGVISLARNIGFAQRLAVLENRFEEIVNRSLPEVAVVESPFHGVNARSALQLAHSRGVLLAVLGRKRVPVEEYSPATIKKTVTGSGRADKEQVRRMLQELLAIRLEGGSTDQSDALAAAYCHLAHDRFEAAVRERRA
jgi:crossover junction endodeoxyribonuclease RuvC